MKKRGRKFWCFDRGLIAILGDLGEE